MSVLTVEEILAGAEATHRVAVPGHLTPGADPASTADSTTDGSADADPAAEATHEVVLRPLLLADVVRLQRSTAQADQLASVLMVQQSLVEPALTVEQVHRLPAGLVEFLLAEVNRISGLSMTSDDLHSLVQEPLARACVTLAREFGWTPDTCADLTVGQLMMYLEMIGRGERP